MTPADVSSSAPVWDGSQVSLSASWPWPCSGVSFSASNPGTTSLSQDDSTSMAIRNENFPSEGYSIRPSGDEFENKMSKVTIKYDSFFVLIYIFRHSFKQKQAFFHSQDK